MNKCTVDIYGGLGNVLFQMATALSYAHDNNKFFTIHPNCFGHTTHVNNLFYFSNIFQKINSSDIDYNPNSYYIINETDHGFINIPDNIDNNVCFRGYFQSYKYFDKNKEYLKQLLNLEKINYSEKMCSLHVRRGDYLYHPNVYEELDLSYYERAMEMFQDVTFLLFTNDLDWCRHNFSKYKNLKFVDETDPYKSLCMMASCDYHIIANSTFSWWGAYLSNDNSKIIAPNKWFKKDYLSQISKKTYDEFMGDLIPKDWIIL